MVSGGEAVFRWSGRKWLRAEDGVQKCEGRQLFRLDKDAKTVGKGITHCPRIFRNTNLHVKVRKR